MTFKRRQFIKTTLAGSAVLVTKGCGSLASSKSKEDMSGKAKLNISFQEGTPPGETLH